MESIVKNIKQNHHKYLMFFWIAMIPVTILTPLKNSILWVLILSLYANIEASAAAMEAKGQNKD